MIIKYYLVTVGQIIVRSVSQPYRAMTYSKPLAVSCESEIGDNKKHDLVQ